MPARWFPQDRPAGPELPMSMAVAGQLHPPSCYLLAEPRQLPVQVLVGNVDVLVHIQNSS